MNNFEYYRPKSVQEALELRRDKGDEAFWYAGGTELLLAMKMGLLQVRALIDIKHVPELHQLEVAAGVISIGAAVTYDRLLTDPLIAETAPVLCDVVRRVGNARVRSSGTLVGNLCFADPRSDPATLLSAWDASIEVMSLDGKRRTEKVIDFIQGPYSVLLDGGDLVLGVSIPAVPATGYCKVQYFERPTLAVAVAGNVEGGRFDGAPRVVVGAGSPRPILAVAAGSALAGLPLDPDDEAVIEASRKAIDEVDMVDDLAGSAEYKSYLLPRLVRDAISKLRSSVSARV